jgi:sarcosine oxidase subunit beta
MDAEFRQCGYLFLATTPAHLQHFKSRVAFQRRFGVEVSLISREEVASAWPFLYTDDGAAYSKKDGIAGPYESRSPSRTPRSRRRRLSREDGGHGDRRARRGAGAPRWTIGSDVGRAAGPDTSLREVPQNQCSITPYRRHLYMTENFPEIPDDIPLTIDSGTGLYFRGDGWNCSAWWTVRPADRA